MECRNVNFNNYYCDWVVCIQKRNGIVICVPFFMNYLFLGGGKLQYCTLLLDIIVLELNLMCQLQPLLEGL